MRVRADVMYIRFVAPVRLVEARADAGLFSILDEAERDAPEWLRDAIEREVAWFNRCMPVPRRFGVRTRKSDRRWAGVCWFRPEAREELRRAYALASLLCEAGVSVARIKSRRPGDIVYRDDVQVVAIPRRGSEPVWRPN